MFIKFVSWSSQRIFNMKIFQPSASKLSILQILAAVCNYRNSTAAGIMWRCTEYEWIFWCDIDCRYSLLQSDLQYNFSGRSLSIMGYFTMFSFHQNNNSHCVSLQDVDILVETTILSMLCPNWEVAGVTICGTMGDWLLGYWSSGFQKAEWRIVYGIVILRRCSQGRLLSRESRRMNFHGLWWQEKR